MNSGKYGYNGTLVFVQLFMYLNKCKSRTLVIL